MEDLFIFNPYGVPVALSGILLAAMTVFCLTRKERTAKAFGLICLALTLYFLGMLFYYFSKTASTHWLWSRIPFIGSIPLVVAFYYFTLVFLDLWPRHRLTLVILGATATVLLPAAFFSDLFITHAQRFFFGYYPRLGSLGLVFMLYLITGLGMALSLWYRAYRNEPCPMQRRRISILGTGFSLTLLGIVDFMPCFGLTMYPAFYLVALFVMGFMGYAVFVYRVTSVQALLSVVFRRAAAILIATVPWSVFSFLLFTRLEHLSHTSAFLYSLGLFVFMAPGILYVDKKLARKEHSHAEVLQNILNEIANLKNPIKLVQSIQAKLVCTLNTPVVQIITKDRIHSRYFFYKHDGNQISVPAAIVPLLKWFENNPEPLIRYDVKQDPRFNPIRKMALLAFSALNAQLLLPLVKGEDLVGLISISDKVNGDIITHTEIIFLHQLVPLAAIALSNAYFYDHIQQLNQALLEANQSLNTRVKERTQELEDALVKMKLLNEEQGRFFELASHNLGTPLTAVKVAFLIMKKQYPEIEIDLQEIIHKNILRLEMLIQNILIISLLENRRLHLKLEPVNICGLIEETYAKVKDSYPDLDVLWSFTPHEQPTLISADAMRLRSVIYNLLSNALKYSDSPARVEVRLATATPDTLRLYTEFLNGTLREDWEYLEVRVIDQGEGISQEEINSIFHKFYQTDNKKRYTGHGLGLQLAKGIIEYHGGAIRAESQVEQGSTFAFVIPTHRKRAAHVSGELDSTPQLQTPFPVPVNQTAFPSSGQENQLGG